MALLNLNKLPSFQNKSQCISEEHPQCIVSKSPQQDKYYEWRDKMYKQGYTDEELAKYINNRNKEIEMTAEERKTPFFIKNKSLDIDVLRELYKNKNKTIKE